MWKKIPKIVAYLSCSAKPLVARNPLGPIVAYLSCSAKPLVARNPLGPKYQIPLAPMGVSLPCPCTRDPPLTPPSALTEFFRCTFLQNNLQTAPPAPLESYLGPQPQKWTTFYHFPVKIGFFRGVGGPRNLILIGVLLFLLLRSPCKNFISYDNPFATHKVFPWDSSTQIN